MNVYLILILLILISYYLKGGNKKCEKFTIKKNTKYLGEVVNGYVKKNNIEQYDNSNKKMIYMLNTSLYDDRKKYENRNNENRNNKNTKLNKTLNIKNIIIICIVIIILFNIL